MRETYTVTEFVLKGYTINEQPEHDFYDHSEHDTVKEAWDVCERFNNNLPDDIIEYRFFAVTSKNQQKTNKILY